MSPPSPSSSSSSNSVGPYSYPVIHVIEDSSLLVAKAVPALLYPAGLDSRAALTRGTVRTEVNAQRLIKIVARNRLRGISDMISQDMSVSGGLLTSQLTNRRLAVSAAQ